MNYITVEKEKAVTIKDNIETLNKGYEKWAYVYKQVIPDTEKETAMKEYERQINVKAKEIIRRLAIAELKAENK